MKNILLVEDSLSDLSKLQLEFSSDKYAVVGASNALEALNLLNSNQEFSAIICDAVLSDMTAIELKHKVDDDFKKFTIPFILLGSQTDYSSMREAFLNGIDDYIIKPYATNDLLNSIDFAIQKHDRYKSLVERKMEETEILFSASFNKSSDYNLFINKYYQILGFNTTFENIVEKFFHTKITIGESVLKYESIIAKEPLKKNIDTALNGLPIEREIDLIYPHRKKISLKVNYDPVRSKTGDILGVIYSAKNITVHKHIQNELRNISHRLEVVAKAANIGIWELYPSKDVLLWNNQMYLLHGRSLADHITFEDWKNLFDENDLKIFLSIIFNNEIRFKELDVAIKIDADKKKFLKLVCYKYKDNTNTEKIIGTCWDVSNYVGMVDEITKAKELAENSNKLKTEFLAQMSHEIRTPISIILNYVNLLKDELGDSYTSTFGDYFNGIENAGKRIIRTIDLILNMSELQLGIYQPIYEELSLLEDILQPIIEEYKYAAKKRNLEFTVEGNLCDSNIYCDRYSLTQIFANLIDNAFKYTKEGSVKLILCCNDNKQYVSIVDTGIGISEEYHTSLFKPFSQEYTGYSRRFEGNGLGLALVKKYCEINGIEISLESRKEHGTKFTLVIPKSI